MKPIRVGMIRCDLHALYYGLLMDKHDVLFVRGPDLVPPEKKRDSWLSGGAYFYHYTSYSNPRRMTSPSVSGFEISRFWDKDPAMAAVASRVFFGRPKVCKTLDEASDDVDLVFIADCNGDGSDHLKLAAPGLKKGVPTFVDKPFAFTVEDARAMVALARRHKAPLFSMSMLYRVPQAEDFRRRFPELGRCSFGTIKGGGSSLAGQIHSISLARKVFGDGVETVCCMGEKPLAHVHLGYGGKPDRPAHGVVLNCDAGPTPHCAFFVSAYGPEGAIHSPPIGDFQFPWGAAEILKQVLRMARTGRPPVPYEDLIEPIAIACAARQSQKTGKPVPLGKVWRRKLQ